MPDSVLGLEDVSSQLFTTDVWNRIGDVLKHNPGRVNAAIAYVGTGADTFLNVDSTWSLIVDASKRTVAAHATNPHVLRSWYGRGASIYSLENLHSKMILVEQADGGPSYVAVGSANMSMNAAHRNREAVLLSDTDTACLDARNALQAWRSDAMPLTPSKLKELCDLYDCTPDGQPMDGGETDHPVPEWRPRPTSLVVVPLFQSDDASAEARQIAAELVDANEVSEAADAGIGEQYIDMFWDDDDDHHLTEQTYVIAVDRAKSRRLPRPTAPVYPPARILHVYRDSGEIPTRIYYYALNTVPADHVDFGDLTNVLESINSSTPTGNRTRYDAPRKVEALLSLWPDLFPTLDDSADTR